MKCDIKEIECEFWDGVECSKEECEREHVPECGYKCKGGYLYNKAGRLIPVKEEKELFDKIGIRYLKPEERV
jgi:hypothetical protein